MTAPDLQTTPLVVTVLETLETPERCETGKTILKARSATVKAAKTMDDFFVAEGKGWLKYCKHVAECDTCKTYELWRKNEQDTRFSSQKSRG